MISPSKTAAIIGVGQIGGSFGLALRESNFFEQICGYDKNPERLKLAGAFLDKSYLNLEGAIKNSDVIIIAAPINNILEILKLGFERFPGKLYTDVGSTKLPMVELLKRYENIRYIGGHPLAGTEKKGESGWNASLFKGKPFFWTTDKKQNKEDEQLIVDMIKAVGANPIFISANQHDEAVAMTSHLPLLLSEIMMSSFAEREIQLKPFIGSGFQSLARLAGGSPEMGKDMLISNKKNILTELDKFSDKLLEFKTLIQNNEESFLLEKMKFYQQLYWKTIENSK